MSEGVQINMCFLQIITLLIYGGCLALSIFLMLCLILMVFSNQYPVVKRHEEEKYFWNYKTRQKLEFPSLDDPPSVHLSVIIPAYNEQSRLPTMLNDCYKFLSERREIDIQNKSPDPFKYEIIIVSDGSTDRTVDVASKYSSKCGSENIRVLPLKENRGKGGAVRLGVLSARGTVILFADADGATTFSELSKLEASLEKFFDTDYKRDPGKVCRKLGIAIGSRAHLQNEAIATRSFFRTLLMYGFHFLVWMFAVRSIKDTQCGFKLLTRRAARMCFRNMHVERWAFDVELLYIAQQFKIPIDEVGVEWNEKDGSKITPVWSWIEMGVDLMFIWLRYRIGAWKLRKLDKND